MPLREELMPRLVEAVSVALRQPDRVSDRAAYPDFPMESAYFALLLLAERLGLAVPCVDVNNWPWQRVLRYLVTSETVWGFGAVNAADMAWQCKVVSRLYGQDPELNGRAVLWVAHHGHKLPPPVSFISQLDDTVLMDKNVFPLILKVGLARLLEVDVEHWQARHVRQVVVGMNSTDLHKLVWEKFLVPEARMTVRQALLQEVLRSGEPSCTPCTPFLAIAARVALPVESRPTGGDAWQRLVHHGLTVRTIGTVLGRLVSGADEDVAVKWEVAARGCGMAPRRPLAFVLSELHEYLAEVHPDIRGTLDQGVRQNLLVMVRCTWHTVEASAAALCLAIKWAGRCATRACRLWVEERPSWVADTIVAARTFSSVLGVLHDMLPRGGTASFRLVLVLHAVLPVGAAEYADITKLLSPIPAVLLAADLPVSMLRAHALDFGRFAVWAYLVELDKAKVNTEVSALVDSGRWDVLESILGRLRAWVTRCKSDGGQRDLGDRTLGTALEVLGPHMDLSHAPAGYALELLRLSAVHDLEEERYEQIASCLARLAWDQVLLSLGTADDNMLFVAVAVGYLNDHISASGDSFLMLALPVWLSTASAVDYVHHFTRNATVRSLRTGNNSVCSCESFPGEKLWLLACRMPAATFKPWRSSTSLLS